MCVVWEGSQEASEKNDFGQGFVGFLGGRSRDGRQKSFVEGEVWWETSRQFLIGLLRGDMKGGDKG